MQGSKKRDGIYIMRRMGLPLLIIILIVSTLILVPAVTAGGCSQGIKISSPTSSGGVSDLTTGGNTHGQTISPGGTYVLGDGFIVWISGGDETIVTFSMLDGFKVEKIVANEKITTNKPGNQLTTRTLYDKNGNKVGTVEKTSITVAFTGTKYDAEKTYDNNGKEIGS
ncbi:MAG: hypothetical protein JXQ82_02075, partial [Methanomicrobiaceae archaeon]|nr:hypothetical protein [Methanomicrobiaceae archaeon]